MRKRLDRRLEYTASVMDDRTAAALRPWFPDLDFARIHLVHRGPVSWLVRTVLRQGAMTIDPYIFFGRHRFEPTSPRSLALLAHELVHIQQYQEIGRLRFLLRYVKDRIKARKYSRDLPLESGPYALQDQVLVALQPSDSDTRNV